jgi:hypothetical protein
VTLRFRGREMQHTEFGFDVVKKFIVDLEPYGHPDFPPKLIGKGINLMMSPLPRAKRAKNPKQAEEEREAASAPRPAPVKAQAESNAEAKPVEVKRKETASADKEGGFGNSPFSALS